jgi:primosomal protein N' (replication factor Y)
MVPCGPGIERIEEEVREIFSNARIQLMTKEEMTSNKKSLEIIENITNGEVDIIIGTQIITKGYHFPKLTIVGVIDTDIALTNSDLRAAENSFALMYQLSGRAGREKIQGNIYMQTYSPQSSFIRHLQDHDFSGFVDSELENRKIAGMPPITKIASIIIEDKSEHAAKSQSLRIAKVFKEDENITILGPSPAFMHKIKNKYRYRILFIAKDFKILHQYVSKLLSKLDPKLLRDIRIDVDPYNFG